MRLLRNGSAETAPETTTEIDTTTEAAVYADTRPPTWRIRMTMMALILASSGLLASCTDELSDTSSDRSSTRRSRSEKPDTPMTAPEQESKTLITEQSAETKATSEIKTDTKNPLADPASNPAGTIALQKPDLSPDQLAYYEDLNSRVKTIIPPDAIPSIDTPRFWDAEEASEHYRDDERIIGIDLEGEQRAYSVPHLSSHEIVNDSLGGRPFSVTW